jgi:hypothetical protein
MNKEIKIMLKAKLLSFLILSSFLLCACAPQAVVYKRDSAQMPRQKEEIQVYIFGQSRELANPKPNKVKLMMTSEEEIALGVRSRSEIMFFWTQCIMVAPLCPVLYLLDQPKYSKSNVYDSMEKLSVLQNMLGDHYKLIDSNSHNQSVKDFLRYCKEKKGYCMSLEINEINNLPYVFNMEVGVLTTSTFSTLTRYNYGFAPGYGIHAELYYSKDGKLKKVFDYKDRYHGKATPLDIQGSSFQGKYVADSKEEVLENALYQLKSKMVNSKKIKGYVASKSEKGD